LDALCVSVSECVYVCVCVCVCSDTDSLDQFIVDTDMVSATAEYGIPPSREGRWRGQGQGGGDGGGGGGGGRPRSPPQRVLLMGREGEKLPRTAHRGDRLPGSPNKPYAYSRLLPNSGALKLKPPAGKPPPVSKAASKRHAKGIWM